MGEQLQVSVTLVNQKVGFSGVGRDNPAVAIDYKPPLGDGQGYTSLELLLMSLASCSASTIVPLLRRMHKDVAGFSVSATGIRRDTHPTCFQTISLAFVLTSSDASETDLQKAIALSEETYCPVWAMLKNNVEISTSFQIMTPEGNRADLRSLAEP